MHIVLEIVVCLLISFSRSWYCPLVLSSLSPSLSPSSSYILQRYKLLLSQMYDLLLWYRVTLPRLSLSFCPSPFLAPFYFAYRLKSVLILL